MGCAIVQLFLKKAAFFKKKKKGGFFVKKIENLASSQMLMWLVMSGSEDGKGEEILLGAEGQCGVLVPEPGKGSLWPLISQLWPFSHQGRSHRNISFYCVAMREEASSV